MNRLQLHRTSTFTMSLLFAIGFSLLAVTPVSAQLEGLWKQPACDLHVSSEF